jgi:predicted TIM-barrel fold metal-dependent hydrolase
MTVLAAEEEARELGSPFVVVSSDTHVGPWLQRDLRAYCPGAHLQAFDAYVEHHHAHEEAMREASSDYVFTEVEPGKWTRGGHNLKTAGHYDVHARLRDMDYDGIAAEVVFHGSTNDEPIPFSTLGDPRAILFFRNKAPEDPQLAAVGRHMYNRWLSDFCSVQPERHVGLAHLPIWDVDAAVREAEWARSAGLKAINFPAHQSWLPPYNDRSWEPLWSAAEALQMPLVTHLGGGAEIDYMGDGAREIRVFEDTVINGKRMLPWLIFSGVFERHPGLKVVITEVPGYWWPQWLRDLDSVWDVRNPNQRTGTDGRGTCPRPPSEYFEENVFVGASFMSRTEAETASREGYWGNYMWGSDYPHSEGTFHYPESWDETPTTRIALSNVFHDLPEGHVRAMLGETASRVYGLEHSALERVAARIAAPTTTTINHPLPKPDHAVSLAFRGPGAWGP